MAIFTAAVLQMRSGIDLARNAAAFETLVREAADQGATCIQSPEMTGALVRDRAALRAMITDESSDLIASTAARLAKELAVTSMSARPHRARRRQGRQPSLHLRRRRPPDRRAYDKIHMFDVDLDDGESWREVGDVPSRRARRCGRSVVAKLGLAICYDLRFPAAVPGGGAGWRRDPGRAGRLHTTDWRSALACAAARARHRERRLGDRCRSRWHP